MTPRSSRISRVRGWMPLPREPKKGVSAASIRWNAILEGGEERRRTETVRKS